VTGLSAERRRLLEQRLAARPPAGRLAPEAIPARPEGPVPLSAGQAALLYEHQLRPDRAGYNVVHAYRVHGEVDLDRLGDAIRRAAVRHEPLRHGFGPDRRLLAPSEAVQVVEIATDEPGFSDLARREAAERFDLERGPLLRATLCRLGHDLVGLVLAVHHVSSDAASLGSLWRDIDEYYQGAEPAGVAVRYSDHAHWQATRRTAEDVSYWTEHLGPEPAAVSLPVAAPAAPGSDGYRTVPLDVRPDDLRSVGWRPAPFFLGVLAAHLQRCTDADDVVVGLAASTRDHPSVDRLVGYFLNVLPLRLRVDPAADVSALVEGTEAVLAAGLAHRTVPYAEITAALRRRGDRVVDPVRVLFVVDDVHEPALHGCTVTGQLVHNGCAVTDLTVFVRIRDDRFELSVEWDGSRYGDDDVGAFAEELASFAHWAAVHPRAPLLDAPAEADLAGPVLEDELRPLPDLIAERCATAPARPAVSCGVEHLDAAELLDRVATAAGVLAGHGVVAGDRVGVLLGRSVDLVVAVLAAQWLGAAYVPIDPAYPAERMRRIVEQAGVRCTVVGPGLVAPAGSGTIIPAPELLGPVPASAAPVVTPRAGLDDPAYVIFTSGSTGIPRGVPIRQRQLASSTLARSVCYDAAPERYLLVSSFGFDSSVAGLFWTLATGGELVLPTEAEVHDVDALAALVERRSISHVLMVPTLYAALVDRAAHSLGSLRCAIVAGEQCPAGLVVRHHGLLGDAELWNEYGPTEATVWATVHRCMPFDDPVPIGMPIAGTVVRVADRWCRPRPQGLAGELLIAGPGLADGYLASPEDTARAFVHDRSGTRFYRTGDVVRRRPDGTLVFLGRSDHQLSVGGVRVEAEEIEAALVAAGASAAVVRVERQLDGDVLDALAAMTPPEASALLHGAAGSASPATALAAGLARNAPGREILVAYVEGVGVQPDALRAALRSRLPAAAVPTVIEPVAVLARTEHGKVDRLALAPPLRVRRAVGSGGSSSVLDVVVDAWRGALDRRDVGADSDFFEAGGDSLLAVELAASLERRLGRRVPISALVLGRTPRRLAVLLEETDGPDRPSPTAVRSNVVPLRKAGDRPPLVLLPPGGGNLIVYDPFVQAFDPRFPVYGFDLPGFDRDEDLPSGVEQLCDTYLPQLRALQPHGPYRFLGWSFGGVVALELAQRLTAEGETVDLVAMIDTLVPGLQRAGRLRAYVELARGGDLLGVGRKLVRMVQVRAMLLLARRKGRRAAESGTTLDAVDRNTWLTIKVDEIVERYRARPYAGRVVFFAAQNTHAWRTTEPWRRLIPGLEVVAVDGTHEGPDGLLSGSRAGHIAAEIAARLT
jgi:amino acid adenylation domain-containing protein